MFDEDTPSLADQVVIQPSWVYTDLVGLLLSFGAGLPPPYIKYQNGWANLDEVKKKLTTKYASGDVAVKILEALGFLIVREDRVLVPAKLRDERPDKFWKPRPGAKVFGARRVECTNNADMSTALFPLVQSRLYHAFLEEYDDQLPLWRDGVLIACGEFGEAEAMVLARPGRRSIDVVSRAEDDDREDCCRLLHRLVGDVMTMAKDVSPGSLLQKKFLSSRELKELSQTGLRQVLSVVYSEERVHRALQKGKAVSDGFGSPAEKPSNMLLSPKEEFGKNLV